MAATKQSAALLALTQAALALPCAQAAAAEAEGMQLGYLYSAYREADIKASRTATGRDEARYDIDSHLFKLVVPFAESTFNADLTYETMSGASPWYVTPGVDGRPVQVMSGASIREERIDIQSSWSMPVKRAQLALSAGYSNEDDYEAISGGLEMQLENASRTLTWSGGVGYSSDTLEPTDGGSLRFANRIVEADKSTWNLYGGVALVVNARTVIQGSVSYADHDGFLSDPYKQAWIQSFANVVNDSRPDGRRAVAVSARLRHKFEAINAALHVDYRFHDDDWEIQSHTLEVSLHQQLGQSWSLVPMLRWYSQSQAFFYDAYYAAPRADGFASSDYRLSPFGALSARLDLTKTLGAWTIATGFEYYKADSSYALEGVNVESPGLVQYMGAQLRLSYRF